MSNKEKQFANYKEVVDFAFSFAKAGGSVNFVSEEKVFARNAIFQEDIIIKRNNDGVSYTGYYK